MTTQTAQLGIEVTDSGTAAATEAKVGRSLRNLAQSAKDTGRAAGEGLQAMGAGGEAAAAKVDRSAKSLIDSIQRTTAAMEAGSKGSADYYRALASQRGINADALAPYLAQLEAATKKQQELARSAGVSAAQTTAAMRSIPAQMTDIVTQLAGGQSPLLILTQQGGQLKDMFGSVGGALKGVGTYVAGLVNPFTLAAGAAAALAYAYEKGAEEARAYEKALILTGNAAGTTAGQLQVAARAVSDSMGTQGAAAEALTALVSTGRVGAEQLQTAAQAAVASQRLLGVSVEESAKAFASLGKDPLQASLKLNEQYRYLTTAVLEQITALERQGKTAEAAAVAQQAYADAMLSRASKLADNLGGVEKAWIRIKDEASKAWDAMLNIGRESTLQDKLEQAAARFAMLQRQQQARGLRGAPDSQQDKDELTQADETLRLLQRQSAAQGTVAAEAANAAAQTESRAKWDKDSLQYLSNQKKMQEEITRARNEGAAAGATTEEIERRIARIRQNYDTGVNLVAVQSSEQQRLEIIKRAQDQINLLRATGAISERTQIEETTRLDLEALAARRRATEAEIRIAGGKQNSEREVAQLRKQLSEIDAQTETRRLQGANALTLANERLAQSIRSVNAAYYQQEQDDRTKALADEANAQLSVQNSLYETVRIQREQGQLDALEWSMLGRSNEERQIAVERLKIQLQLQREIEKINATLGADQSWRDSMIQQATENAATAAAQVQNRVYLSEWQRTSDQIGQSLSDALMQGGKSASEYLKGLFRSMVLRPVLQAVISPITGAVASAFMPGAASASGGGGLGALSAAGNAASLYRTGSSLYASGVAGTAGSFVSGIGSLTGSSALSAYGSGMGMTAAQAAEASSMYWGASTAASTAAEAAAYEAAATSITAGASTGASISAAMSSLAAAAPYVAAALLVANALGVFRSTKQVGTGLLGTVGDTTDVDQYALMRKSGTLFSGPSYSLQESDASQAVVDAIKSGVGSMLTSARAQAAALGLGSNLAAFSTTLGSDQLGGDTGRTGISLDGLSAEQATAKLQAELAKVYDKAASQALGDAGKALAKSGETATQTLARLSDDITGVNRVLDTLGDTLLQTSLTGADAAAKLVDLFGSLDALTSATQAYYQAFYSDAERAATTTRQLSKALSDLGISALPASKAAYRDLVDAQDLTTDSGRKAYAALVSLSGAFAQITDAASEAGKSLQEEIDRLRGTTGSTDAASLQAQFAIKTAAARAGDADALKALPDISKSLEEASKATAASALDVSRMRAWLASSLEETLRVAVPAFASGGVHAGGWAMVGEQGPELVNMQPGRVYSNADSRGLLDTSALEAKVAQLTEQVAGLQDALTATALHTARTATLLNRAMPDGDALATRSAD